MSWAVGPADSDDMVTLEFLGAWLVAKTQLRSERGASLVEYALLLALIAVVCLVALQALGTGLRDNYDESQTSIFGS